MNPDKNKRNAQTRRQLQNARQKQKPFDTLEWLESHLATEENSLDLSTFEGIDPEDVEDAIAKHEGRLQMLRDLIVDFKHSDEK